MSPEIADIFRIHGPDYRDKFAHRMLPSHLKAMEDIEQCRTEALGGQVYRCNTCNEDRYSYHSCKNRHCPKCQNGQAKKWLNTQKALLLPVTHFMVTFTLPEELRDLVSSHQKKLYNVLFRTAAAALRELAMDSRFIGARIGMVAVLHTWTRQMLFHPHVHFLVPGGGLSADGNHWLSSREDFLVHEKPLAILFRAKFRDEIKKTDLFARVDPQVWKKDWVVDCEAVGTGAEAFRYLAPYVFRVAITNNRILKLEDGKVTFLYKDSATGLKKPCTLTAQEFIRRFLCHVLPDRFIKVRYYGFMAPTQRKLLRRVRELLGVEPEQSQSAHQAMDVNKPEDVPRCPKCGDILLFVQTVTPRSRLPP